MHIATSEYTIRHSQNSKPSSDHISLEAVRVSDRRQLGHIHLDLLPVRESTVKLGKISTYYTIRTVGGGVIDYGGNGIGTMLLLQGMLWAKENDARYLVGQFVPEKELYSVKSWYERRSIIVSEDMSSISGIVIAVIRSCQNIVQHY